MNNAYTIYMGRDSSVSIVTGYGLDGPGSNPGGDEIFRTLPDQPCGPLRVHNVYRVFPGVKGVRRCVDHPPHVTPRSKKE